MKTNSRNIIVGDVVLIKNDITSKGIVFHIGTALDSKYYYVLFGSTGDYLCLLRRELIRGR